MYEIDAGGATEWVIVPAAAGMTDDEIIAAYRSELEDHQINVHSVQPVENLDVLMFRGDGDEARISARSTIEDYDSPQPGSRQLWIVASTEY